MILYIAITASITGSDSHKYAVALAARFVKDVHLGAGHWMPADVS